MTKEYRCCKSWVQRPSSLYIRVNGLQIRNPFAETA